MEFYVPYAAAENIIEILKLSMSRLSADIKGEQKQVTIESEKGTFVYN